MRKKIKASDGVAAEHRTASRMQSEGGRRNDIRPYTRQFYRGNGICIALALVHTVVLTCANLLVSWLLQQILDLVSGAKTGFTFGQLAALAGICVLLFTAAYGFAYVSRPRFMARAMEQYKNFVFQQLSQKGAAAFAGENTSRYSSALSNDAATIERGYLGNFFKILNQSVMLVGALLMMLWYSPVLTAVSIGLSLLPVVVSVLAGNRASAAEKQVSDRNETYMSTLQDSLSGFSVMKTFRAEVQMCRIFADSVRQVAAAKEIREKIHILIEMLVTVSSILVQVGVFLVGAWLAVSGKGVTAGTVLVFVQLMNYVLMPIGTIPSCLAEQKAARALIEKLAGALEEHEDAECGCEKKTLEEGIRVENLDFAYEEGKPVLQNLSFPFKVGKSYALVGVSGSGKSTLLQLLMASYTEFDGSICYDDEEVREIRRDNLYELVSLVQQNVFLFNASIRDNITMFSAFPEEEVERAIQLAGLSELIAERGEGYLCGENGKGLSGGEKQRISIARSLLKRSRVLLVDEATASLDPATAFQVSSAILDLDEMLRIVVTHSLDEALLKRYDCILTLKNGGLAEAGTFEELMEQKGYFYTLYTVAKEEMLHLDY
ncbi:MAG: ABC transporter ATP-binding protein [Firmicutes bacterium]|nr:ABC transporter ATP-binding protein [Bacillota bacterium]